MGLEFIVGGIFRLFPEIASIFRKKQEFAHELALLKLQLEVDKARGAMALQSLEKQGELEALRAEMNAIADINALQLTPSVKTGITWVDALGGLADAMSKFVRPLLTYWYCVAAYGAYKTAVYISLLSGGISWEQAIIQAWTPADYSVMVSIIGFWFVDRVLRRMNGK